MIVIKLKCKQTRKNGKKFKNKLFYIYSYVKTDFDLVRMFDVWRWQVSAWFRILCPESVLKSTSKRLSTLSFEVSSRSSYLRLQTRTESVPAPVAGIGRRLTNPGSETPVCQSSTDFRLKFAFRCLPIRMMEKLRKRRNGERVWRCSLSRLSLPCAC